MKLLSLFILSVILLSSCISRTNPLDPNSHPDILVPDPVNNLAATCLSPTVVKLTWDKRSGVDGYYLYRSMSRDGEYIRVDNDMLDSSEYNYFLDENSAFVSGIFYWYKISAYKIYNGKKLEGYRSSPVYVYIQ